MLYDLDFLKYGKPWPPADEVERINTYRINRELYNGEHARIYREQFRRIERVATDYGYTISFPVVLNYQKLISLKLADLIFSEPPQITLPTDAQQEKLDKVVKATDLFNIAHTSAIDASRYGDAVLTKTVRDGAPVITASSPDYWFPVVDRTNIQNRLYDVQAWAYLADSDRREYRLKVTIYSAAGGAEQVEYELVNAISNADGEPTSFRVGYEIPGSRKVLAADDVGGMLVTAHNLLTTDAIYGVSDYDIVDSPLSEIMVRVSQIAKVLDAHSAPTMSGPESAIEQDSDGIHATMRAGNYYPRSSNEEPDIKYHVWDAALAANFECIELLMHQLYTLSEMGSMLLGDFSATTGQVPSGTALRRLMMSPLAKAARMRNSYDRAIKKLLAACMQDAGETIRPEDISIIWNDGLPNDPAEEATIMSVRTSGKATISQWSAAQRLDNLSDEDTQTELDMIRQDDDAGAMVGVSGTVEEGDDLDQL